MRSQWLPTITATLLLYFRRLLWFLFVVEIVLCYENIS